MLIAVASCLAGCPRKLPCVAGLAHGEGGHLQKNLRGRVCAARGLLGQVDLKQGRISNENVSRAPRRRAENRLCKGGGAAQNWACAGLLVHNFGCPAWIPDWSQSRTEVEKCGP